MSPAPRCLLSVHGQGEKPAFTEVPYPETQECLGGFWVIEAVSPATPRNGPT